MRLVEFKDSSKDKYSKIDLDKARRPRLTLRHLNKLKSYNASKKKEEEPLTRKPKVTGENKMKQESTKQ